MGKPKIIPRKICVVTTARADYGLLYWLMKEIRSDRRLQLQIIATGMHLAPEFGSTYKIIEADGFKLDRKIEMLLSADSEVATIKSVGIGLMALADALNGLQPDILVLLGDRFELISAAIAALILKIPIAHIHGGETSQGAFDESIRHSLTKMAAIHFPATEVYRRRIIQMGEQPGRVFNFGAPGLDTIYRQRLPDKSELADLLDFDLTGSVAIVTLHPVTLECQTAARQIGNLLTALKGGNLKAIFTQTNADPQGRVINDRIREFCAEMPDRFKFVDNLGTVAYLSSLKHLDVMIGNSSSGLTEAPSFRMPVVNIGDRQQGRVKAGNIIDVKESVEDITRGIRIALSDKFRAKIRTVKNPYDAGQDGRSSFRIKETLRSINLSDDLLKKQFRDIEFRATHE